MESYISGCYTVKDEELFMSLALAMESEGVFLEPSAHAGCLCAIHLLKNGQNYIEKHHLQDIMEQATHLVWATGGSMVPQEMREEYMAKVNM
ncbi:putative D-serine dehydratase OS=Lysinibacillus sphaericus OX=1421 GN=dsdA PE=3 SV=1 [Lysinibacillus sphaericus]